MVNRAGGQTAQALQRQMHGTIERVTSKVFLLSPSTVEVTPAEKVRSSDRGLFNPS